METILPNLGLSALFAVLGFILLFLSYWLSDHLMPGDTHGKIFDEGNVAVAILAGSFIIGLALIIASAIA